MLTTNEGATATRPPPTAQLHNIGQLALRAVKVRALPYGYPLLIIGHFHACSMIRIVGVIPNVGVPSVTAAADAMPPEVCVIHYYQLLTQAESAAALILQHKVLLTY